MQEAVGSRQQAAHTHAHTHTHTHTHTPGMCARLFLGRCAEALRSHF
jgi:hypothetical protein